MLIRLLVVCFILVATPTWACTFGTDCYCDKVVPEAGELYDALLLVCEDFEAPTLRSDVGSGTTTASARGSGGTNAFGPWYDATGQTGNRGVNSYWAKRYGNGTDNFLFSSGQPSSPTFGAACNFSLCTGMKVWDETNRWSANAYAPLAAIYTQASHFSEENESLTAPSNTSSGGSGVFDGNGTMAWRIPAGETHGIAGEASFEASTEVGLTMAMAYPVNSLDSGIWGTSGAPAAWKHNEWATVNAPNCGFDGLFAFYNQVGPRSGRPFAGFIGAFGAGCTGGNYSGSITDVSAGAAQLIDGGIGIYWNTPTNYDQATDWPEGTWGCVRGHLVISGGSQHYRVWFQGPNMESERLLIDITYTTSTLDNAGGYSGLKWNAYANTNQGGGYVESTALTFRYEDNVHIRAGEPVSCAQIGFSATGVGGPGSMDVRRQPPGQAKKVAKGR